MNLLKTTHTPRIQYYFLQICQCVSENNPKNRTSHEINVGKLYTVYTIIVMVFVTVEKQCNVKFTKKQVLCQFNSFTEYP